MKTDRKLKLNEKGFWPKWFGKFFFTLISVKVWGLVAGTAISTWLLLIHLRNEPVIIGEKVIEYGINGAQWVTFNTTIWALIFGMKEIFRISEQRDFTEKLCLNEEMENKITLAGIMTKKASGKQVMSVSTGFEIVGHEPDEN